MRPRILPLAVVGALAAVLLSGCTFSLNPQAKTVPADDVATLAEDSLEKDAGTRPDITCPGDDEGEVILEVDKKITCLLTDPATGLEYDVVITFTDVTRDSYDISIKVADLPNNPPQPTAEPTDPVDAPTVTGAQIAALAVQALTPGLGFVPAISCPEPEVQVVVGNVTYCSYDADGASHDVQVTVTQYDPAQGTYAINAEVIS